MNRNMYTVGKWLSFLAQTVTTSIVIRRLAKPGVDELLVWGLALGITFLATLLEYGYVERVFLPFFQNLAKGEISWEALVEFGSKTLPVVPIILLDIGSSTWGLSAFFPWEFSLAVGIMLFPLVEIFAILEKEA